MMPNIESSQKLMCLIHLELLEHLLTITLSILHNIFAFVFIAHKLTVCILVYVATTYPLLRAYCGFRYQTMPRAYVPDLHGVVRISFNSNVIDLTPRRMRLCDIRAYKYSTSTSV